jgi:hypothetical protein
MRTTQVAGAFIVAAAIAVTSCTDNNPAGPRALSPLSKPSNIAELSCRANVVSRSVLCGPASPASGTGNNTVLVGGQHQFVDVSTSAVAYSGTNFTFNLALQNLIPQPLGSTNGTTPDTAGVEVFFNSGPTVTDGTGVIIVNGDGIGTFTAGAQPFYRYIGAHLGGDGILSPNETTSSRQWSLTVPATALSFTFNLLVRTEVPHPNGYVDVTPGSDTILSGGNAPLTATVRNFLGVAVGGAVTWSSLDSTIATVNSSGQVTAVAPGATSIVATSSGRTGQASIAVCPNLAVGGTYTITTSSVCVGGGAGAKEYTVVPVRTAVTSFAYSFTATGIVGVTGPPSPDMIPNNNVMLPFEGGKTLSVIHSLTPDDDVHMKLLRRSTDLARTMGRNDLVRRPSMDPRIRQSIVPGVPAVGTVMNLNVGQGFCTPTDIRASTVKSVGTHVILMEDNSNPSGGFTTAQYDSIAATFDTLVYPAVAGNFGAPFDVDGNGRMIALYTSAVNDLTPAGSSAYVGGFFYSRDLFATASCAGSNQGEMFYMLAPDPSAAHGNVRSAAFVKSVTIGTLGHEFQHLINASRRLYGAGGPYPLEQVWLNEGLSHISEEEVYYASTLHGPGENIGLTQLTASQGQQDRFFQFEEPNFGRLRQWLLRPDTAGAFKNADNLAIRGASWAFLRYAADRKGGLESDLWSGLAFSPDTGITNLTNRLGTDPMPWFRDFSMAMYADDGVSGINSIYKQPSWNFRQIYAALDYDPGPSCSCAYPLQVQNPSNGVLLNFTLTQGGGTGFIRLGVATNAFAGITTAAPSAGLRITLMRTK